MSQSSLLGKDSVEKSLGAVVTKMRIKIPTFDNSALIKGYAKTMIGRCMNPRMQDTRGLLLMFPRICQVEGRVAGADLGSGRFQLDFDEEEDSEAVLKMEPFHFDGWMVSLVRWKPTVDPSYPSAITFWIQVLDIPIEYWAYPTFESIGGALGKVVKVDIDGGRVQVILDGYKPLCFETTIEFGNGEETPISLRYERLYGFCSYCFSLCHDVEHCEKKYGTRRPSHHSMSGSDGAGAQNWSYKGAVVQDRHPKHDTEGKGKGIATGKDREEERIVPSNSQTNSFGKGKQTKFVQGEGSSRYKRFTNYAQFNDHRFHEQKKLKVKAKDASKVKVVDSSETQAAQTVVVKPKKIVRKSLVFEDETGDSSIQHLDHKEQEGVENLVAVPEVKAPTAQLSIQDDLASIEQPLDVPADTTDPELAMSQPEEGGIAIGDMELEFDTETDNLLDSEDLPMLEQTDSGYGADASEPAVEAVDPIDDTLEIIVNQGTEAVKNRDTGKGKEVSVAKKKTGRLVLPGVTTRKRLVQTLISPRKRTAPKHGSNQGDDKFPPDQGLEKGGPGGSQPPQNLA